VLAAVGLAVSERAAGRDSARNHAIARVVKDGRRHIRSAKD